jgi:uncharacterized membrane protein YbhN (UPF0104 family)
MYWVLRRFEHDGRAAAIRLIGLNTAVYLVFGAIAWSVAGLAIVTAEAPLSMTVPWLVGLPIVMFAARWFTAPTRLARWVEPRPGVMRRALATGVGAAAWVRRRLGDASSRPVFGWAACSWLGDVASLWAALRAFGADPGLLAVTAAYTTGYLVQSLPIPMIATAGVDTATTLLLRSVGVPLDLALLGVVTHRLFAFWLPIVPGSMFALTLSRLSAERVGGRNTASETAS